MTYNDAYRRQVELLIQTLPHVGDENCFALKGGTAINLFIRDMPRLSVDIDLTYLPVADRSASLAEIDAALKRISENIRHSDSSVQITESAPRTQGEITKLVVRARDRTQIKIEVTPVLRGCVYDPRIMAVSAKVEDQFGFTETNVLSFADLYAGKIMAALDRQHPRDLFDVHLLLENEGIAPDTRAALIVALDTLLDARNRLITDVIGNMPDHHKAFLVSFYSRRPDWQLLGLEGVSALPAVKWRELNLDRSGKGTTEKIVRKLQRAIHA